MDVKKGIESLRKGREREIKEREDKRLNIFVT